MLDHAQHVAHIGAVIVVGPFGSAIRFGQVLNLAAVAAHLDTDVTVAFGHEATHILHHLLRVAPVGVSVDGGALTAFAAQQLVDRHAGHLALDVPERFVNAGDGVVQHGPIAPVAVHHRHLPDFFDAADVAPDEERRWKSAYPKDTGAPFNVALEREPINLFAMHERHHEGLLPSYSIDRKKHDVLVVLVLIDQLAHIGKRSTARPAVGKPEVKHNYASFVIPQ